MLKLTEETGRHKEQTKVLFLFYTIFFLLLLSTEEKNQIHI